MMAEFNDEYWKRTQKDGYKAYFQGKRRNDNPHLICDTAAQ